MPAFPGQRLLNQTAHFIGERAQQLQHLNRHDLMNEYTPAPLNKYWNAATVSCVTLILLLAPGLFVRVPLAALWVGLSFVLACIQGVYVVYQLVMIALSLSLLILLRVAKNAYTLITKLWYRQPPWRRRRVARAVRVRQPPPAARPPAGVRPPPSALRRGVLVSANRR